MAQLTLNHTTLLGATTGTIASLVLPLAGRLLLLPSASVVEIVDPAGLSPVSGRPDWLVGQVNYREQPVPVVSFEAMNGQGRPREQVRIAIVSGISRQAELPFYGIIMQGAPRAAKVKIAELEDLESAPTGPVEYLQVRYAGELACIPDLDALEALLLTA